MQEFFSISCRILPLPRLFSQLVNFDISFLSYYIYHLPKEKQPVIKPQAVFLYIQLFFSKTMIGQLTCCKCEKFTELAELKNQCSIIFFIEFIFYKISTTMNNTSLLIYICQDCFQGFLSVFLFHQCTGHSFDLFHGKN